MNPEIPTPPEDESGNTRQLWSGMDPDKRYRIKTRLGQGGMATVHKAFDRTLRRNVALKMLRKDRISKKGHTLHRFMEEAQVTSQIQHP
ncbi:MAG: hypothetical protein KJ831_15705, partial [Candidatus Eisenbacteria bacterium]|nr:hypothetical protein [Candidatus Eisenbacteria bacterium]